MTERTQIEMDGTVYDVLNNWKRKPGQVVVIDDSGVRIIRPTKDIGVVKTCSDQHNNQRD